MKHLRGKLLFFLFAILILCNSPTSAQNAEVLSVHFLASESQTTGSCTYVRCGNVDVLIDAGASEQDLPKLHAYLKREMRDGTLDYVILTHAHADHLACVATDPAADNLLELFQIGTILDFSFCNPENQGKLYQNYLQNRAEAIARGARHLTAKDCIDQGQSRFDLGAGATLTVLNNPYYHTPVTKSENDHSLCLLIRYGDFSFLATGDLEAKGEHGLLQYNVLPPITLYQVGHHGSDTASSPALLAAIRPQIAVISCCAGSAEYSEAVAGQFPSPAVIERLTAYTHRIYVTSRCLDSEDGSAVPWNGDVVVTVRAQGVSIHTSHSDIPLSKSEWWQEKVAFS